MTRSRIALALLLVLAVSIGLAAPGASAQTKPEGEMRFAIYVTISPTWFDPGEVTGFITPFWLLWAMHDALVKTMPGKTMAPSLAESWTVSADQKTYDFKLRQNLKFHNGDPFTAEDVKFSFQRAKGYKILKEKVRDIEVVGPHPRALPPARAVARLHDLLRHHGRRATAGSCRRSTSEQVGDDGFKKHPIGLGPYKFVSHTPGRGAGAGGLRGLLAQDALGEASRLQERAGVDDAVAMLKRGEVDIAYLLEVPQAQEIKRDPNLKLAFSGGIATFYLDYFDMWDPKSPWADRRVRLAASHASTARR